LSLPACRFAPSVTMPIHSFLGCSCNRVQDKNSQWAAILPSVRQFQVAVVVGKLAAGKRWSAIRMVLQKSASSEIGQRFLDPTSLIENPQRTTRRLPTEKRSGGSFVSSEWKLPMLVQDGDIFPFLDVWKGGLILDVGRYIVAAGFLAVIPKVFWNFWNAGLFILKRADNLGLSNRSW